jgi:hypothetical protein
MSQELPLGFKRLSSANWLTVDPAWEGVLISLAGSDPSTGWVEDLTRVDLMLRYRSRFRRYSRWHEGRWSTALCLSIAYTWGRTVAPSIGSRGLASMPYAECTVAGKDICQKD